MRILMLLLGRLPLPVIMVLAGWYGGAKYGAPDFALNAVESAASGAVHMVSSLLNKNEDSADDADSSDDSAPDSTDDTDDAAAAPASTFAASSEETLHLCDMNISNAPRADSHGVVTKASTQVELNGVVLMLQPATKACLSSGFGERGYSPHRGIDYYSDQGGAALAAADGVILEAKYRDDYGNYIVIDHGSNVYTRYAHLANFAAAIREGAGVRQGQRLGPIGKSGQAGAVHLHYEIRTGDYNTNAGAFGLTPLDPFSLHMAD